MEKISFFRNLDIDLCKLHSRKIPCLDIWQQIERDRTRAVDLKRTARMYSLIFNDVVVT